MMHQNLHILSSIKSAKQLLKVAMAAPLLLAMSISAQATPEPEYQIIRQIGDIELRQYAAYAVAEVVVPGPASEAGSQAFPILAGYIFGKNKGDKKLAMTAPVTQSAVPTKLEMTAPVTQSAAGQGFLVQFVLPKGVMLANAPEPTDTRVQLRDVSARQVAVVRYSGFWTAAQNEEQLGKLQAALCAADVAWTGDPVYARFNGPMTPWFLKRHEIWLNVALNPPIR